MCTARALRSHRDGAVARAAAAAAASARAHSGGERADGRHACGHAAVQRRAVRGQGDVGLCVGPPAERRGARARAAGLRGRWRLRIRSRNVVELGPRCKGRKIKSGLFSQFHGGHPWRPCVPHCSPRPADGGLKCIGKRRSGPFKSNFFPAARPIMVGPQRAPRVFWPYGVFFRHLLRFWHRPTIFLI